MPHDGSLLQATVVFLLAVVLLVPLAQRLRMGAVPGYLLAGMLIGPSVLGLLNNPDNVARLSEMGVVMLLFVIGLELSPQRLWTMRRALFGVGTLQVGLSAWCLGYWPIGCSTSRVRPPSCWAWAWRCLPPRLACRYSPSARTWASPTAAWLWPSCCSRTSQPFL